MNNKTYIKRNFEELYNYRENKRYIASILVDVNLRKKKKYMDSFLLLQEKKLLKNTHWIILNI